MVKRDCGRWLEELSRAIPTVVVAVRDERGRDVLDARATIDGQSIPIDGKPVPLDPGRHEVRAVRSGASSVAQEIVVAEGDRDRTVTLTLATPAPPPPPPPSPSASSSPAATTERRRDVPIMQPAPAPVDRAEDRGVPAGVWALGGVGVVAMGAFTYFAIRGAGDRSTFGCDRGCVDADYTQVKHELLAADVSLGVGLATLGAAVVWWLVTREPPAKASGVARGFVSMAFE
jgi:hypothetical protein